MKTTFILHNNFDTETDRYKKEVVGLVAEKFGLRRTLIENIPAHFTLKYWFDADESQLAALETTLGRFCEEAAASTVTIDGVQGFPPSVAFLAVRHSELSRRTFDSLIGALRAFPWMTWDKFDAENLYPHQTIAEDCGELYSSVLAYLETLHTEPVEARFDNITVTKLVGVQNGYPMLETYKVFKFRL